ncbi:YiiX/YebB-like N1pC/P60 family cysteine hydrolase [Winogradskyella sp. 4-2091]|uniref:YiiX/YebB-like N1pC/P60 family cysteine hydrolase n=1 Tax=Winogradskyella sp. 4-2091 TaxID=3381659 RepID=UPI0038925453
MKVFVTVLISVLCLSCTFNTLQIKTGDIVFRGKVNSNLSEAINDVTQTTKSTNYTHIGICKVIDNEVIVYHSDLGKGVVKESLELFKTSTDTINYNVDLYRINPIDIKQIEQAISTADSLLGQSYNTTYILEDEGYYCSEFIYELFKTDSIFQLEPMTFKNSKTNEFHDGWVEHYENLDIDIPEGKLGCNPNGMANSDKIFFIRKIQ